MRYFDESDGVYAVKNGRRTRLKHTYVLDAVVEGDTLKSGKFLSGVTTVIHETSGAGGLIQWAADMAVEYIRDNSVTYIECLNLLGGIKQEVLPKEYSALVVTTDTLTEARLAHRKKKEAAGQKGTDLHALAENFIGRCMELNGGYSKDMGLEVDKPIADFIAWAQEKKVKFIASEKKMFNAEYAIAGTCDFVAEIDGKLVIGDVKTFPKMHSADPFIQMGGYSLMYPEKIDGTVVVKICDPTDPRLAKYKTDPFAVYERFAVEEDKDMFLTRLKMYRYNEAFVSPKN